MTKTKGQCQFGMNGTGYRCELPATRKWGDHWFCEEHGRRDKKPDWSNFPESCPRCSSEVLKQFKCQEGSRHTIFKCGTESENSVIWFEGKECSEPTNYFSDLNAIQEAVMKLSEDVRQHSYFRALAKVVGVNEIEEWEKSLSCLDKVINATASQRAEAYLRTIGKWTMNK